MTFNVFQKVFVQSNLLNILKNINNSDKFSIMHNASGCPQQQPNTHTHNQPRQLQMGLCMCGTAGCVLWCVYASILWLNMRTAALTEVPASPLPSLSVLSSLSPSLYLLSISLSLSLYSPPSSLSISLTTLLPLSLFNSLSLHLSLYSPPYSLSTPSCLSTLLPLL